MSTAIFDLVGLIGGTAFVLLGRWIYANPKALYASSLQVNSDGALQRVGAKVFAVLLIFVGSYAAIAAPAGLLIQRGAVVIALGVAAGILGGLFLRPRGTVTPGTEPEAARDDKIKQGWFLTGKGKLFLGTMIGGGAAVSAEALVLPAAGKAGHLPDVALVTILVVAIAMLWEMLFVR